MGSPAKQYRIRVGDRGSKARHWVEPAGLTDLGQVATRLAQYPTPAGVFVGRDARALAKRLRRWWSIVKLQEV